jgi:hypothetical protein
MKKKTTKRNRMVTTAARILAERGKHKFALAVTKLLGSPARGTRVRVSAKQVRLGTKNREPVVAQDDDKESYLQALENVASLSTNQLKLALRDIKGVKPDEVTDEAVKAVMNIGQAVFAAAFHFAPAARYLKAGDEKGTHHMLKKLRGDLRVIMKG